MNPSWPFRSCLWLGVAFVAFSLFGMPGIDMGWPGLHSDGRLRNIAFGETSEYSYSGESDEDEIIPARKKSSARQDEIIPAGTILRGHSGSSQEEAAAGRAGCDEPAASGHGQPTEPPASGHGQPGSSEGKCAGPLIVEAPEPPASFDRRPMAATHPRRRSSLHTMPATPLAGTPAFESATKAS